MKQVGGLLALALALGMTSATWAQDKSGSKGSTSTSKSSSTDTTTTKEKDTKVRGQLPMYYGKLALSDEQKQKIYKIQHEYTDKLDELEKKVETMKAERNSRYLKELTKNQRDRLDDLKKGKDKEEKDK